MCDHDGVFENAEAPCDGVLHVNALAQAFACLLLLCRELCGDVFQIFDRRLFGDAECDLIGELIERSLRFGAFAVCAAHGESELGQVAGDTADSVALFERGQVQHDRSAHAGAEVGRTLRQIAELFVKGEVKAFVEQGVELIGGVIRLLERQARRDDLQADMILLIEHDG